METIKEAKEFLRENFDDGVKCPCCDQYVKLYKRKLNSGMARFLIGLYKLYKKNDKLIRRGVGWEERSPLKFYQNKEVFEIMDIKVSSLDYSVLRHFGLIEARISDDGKKDSGYWRISTSGLLFVTERRPVPRNVFLYNNKRIGVSDEQITIKEALGSKFDYQELMQNK